MKKTLWILFGFLSVAIGLYPAIYFVQDRNFGLLSTKSAALLSDLAWNTGFISTSCLVASPCSWAGCNSTSGFGAIARRYTEHWEKST